MTLICWLLTALASRRAAERLDLHRLCAWQQTEIARLAGEVGAWQAAYLAERAAHQETAEAVVTHCVLSTGHDDQGGRVGPVDTLAQYAVLWRAGQ